MTDEQRLTDALHEIVPSPPHQPGRGPAVEERVRRRRRRTGAATVLAAAAVVVAAVAVPAALSGGDGPDDRIAAPDPTSAPDLTCPPKDQGSTSPDTLPTGAVAVRLCPAGEIDFEVPAGVLTTDVDQLVETVNEQPVADPMAMCTMEMGRAYQLVFAYDDGEAYTVTGELYGCRDLQVGSVTRDGAEAPFREFQRSLRHDSLDADASPREVVAAYVDRLNAHDTAGASALWASLVDVDVPAAYTRIGYQEQQVRFIRTTAPGEVDAEVEARYREEVRDAQVPWREVTFGLTRTETGYRIVEITER